MKHKDNSRQYAFLMVDYMSNSFIEEIQSKIKNDELYKEEENDDYGLEKTPHVTLVPCLDNDADLEKLKKDNKDLRKENKKLKKDLKKSKNKNKEILNSLSWKITKPLRIPKQLIKKMKK